MPLRVSLAEVPADGAAGRAMQRANFSATPGHTKAKIPCCSHVCQDAMECVVLHGAVLTCDCVPYLMGDLTRTAHALRGSRNTLIGCE